MPLYEYRAIEDGTLISLLRPMAEADAPVEDPDSKGRTFERIHSVFSVDAASTKTAPSSPAGGCCGGGGCGCHPN
jgi:hypothetical protein